MSSSRFGSRKFLQMYIAYTVELQSELGPSRMQSGYTRVSLDVDLLIHTHFVLKELTLYKLESWTGGIPWI